ncbi:MAG: thioredoxin domain-containing protein [Mariniphaga sp.]|nr:thioredoxin domain-containing protein [Mariniphaga sp.]
MKKLHFINEAAKFLAASKCLNMHLKKYFLFILLFSLIGCNEKNNIQVIATINNNSIFQDEVDSLTFISKYEIEKQALKNLIKREVVCQEASKQGITIEELIEKEVETKVLNVTSSDYYKYIESNNINKNEIDSVNIITYLKTIKKKEKHDEYTDSLINQFNIEIFLQPMIFKTVNLSNINYFNLSPSNKIVVYLISDYDCPSCQHIEPKINKIINKYENKVNFRFVVFGEYISNKALAANAAALQNKFKEMHAILFQRKKELNDEEILEIAVKLELNLDKFKNDYKNPNNLKKLLRIKEKLIKKEIYSTPTIIVNSKVLDDEFALYTLENIIKNELHKK